MPNDSDNAEFLTTTTLPRSEYSTHFDDIVIPSELKQLLVNHGTTIHRLHAAGVDPRHCGGTGLVYLFGPKGTGKTSLSLGVPNQVAARLDREIVLRMVNPDQLFSSDFGSTPQQVQDLFDRVKRDAEDGRFQCLVVDEAESLFTSRTQLSADTDPSDAMRATNAALRGLDQLIDCPNVLVYATSNHDRVDTAFIDRADLRIKVDNPTAAARAAILTDTFAHLNAQLGTDLPTHPAVLDDLIEATEGISARDLRTLPSGAAMFTGGDPRDLSFEAVEAFVDRGSFGDEGFVLATSDDSFTVDSVAERADTTDAALTFVYDRRATANTVRSDIPAEFLSDAYDRRYKKLKLVADTTPEWVQRAAADAVDIIQATPNRTTDSDEDDVVFVWGEPSDHAASQHVENGSADGTDGTCLSPRRAVFTSHQSTEPEDLLASIKGFVADTLAQADAAFAQSVAVLLDDERVQELFYAVTRLQALDQVRLESEAFSVAVDVAYQPTASEFLAVPPADRVPPMETATISLVIDEDGARQVAAFTPLEVDSVRITTEHVNTVQEAR
jgi:hypothetical protein